MTNNKQLTRAEVPKEALLELDRQRYHNGGKFLPTNYTDLYAERPNYIEDKMHRYRELENGYYTKEVYIQS